MGRTRRCVRRRPDRRHLGRPRLGHRVYQERRHPVGARKARL